MSTTSAHESQTEGLGFLRETVGRGMEALARKTADLLHLGVCVVDTECRPVAFAAPGEAAGGCPPQHVLSGLIRAAVSSGIQLPAVVPGPKADTWLCINPVCERGEEVLGYLVVWSAPQIPPAHARGVLEVGAFAAAIEFSRQRSLWRVRRELEEEFFAYLLSDQEHSEEELLRRAGVLGLHLDHSYWPCLIDSGERFELSDRTWALADRELSRKVGSSFLGINEGVVFVLVSNGRGGQGKRDAVAAALRRLLPIIEPDPKGRSLVLLTGRPVAIGQLGREWTDLKLTRRAIQGLGGLSGLHFAEEYALPRLLLSGLHRQEATRFVEKIIGPLAGYDRENKTRLMRTLETYFDCGCSLSATAQATNYHRNTVSRQLEKVQSILGYDLEEPGKRLSLHLATKIHRMLLD